MYNDFLSFCITFFISGSISVLTKTITAPIDRIKIILQNQDSSYQVLSGERVKYNGAWDIFKRLPKEQGFYSFWRGNGVNVIRTFPSQALNFSLFDAYKSLFSKTLGFNKEFSHFLAGGLSGASSAIIIYPLDFCQTRLASDFGSDPSIKKHIVKREYATLRGCLRQVYKKEGFFGYYKGMSVQVLGVFVYRTFYFGHYNMMKNSAMESQSTKTGQDVYKLSFSTKAVIAAFTTSVASIIAYPLDTVGRRLMLDSARPKKYKIFKTTHGAFKTFYSKYGFRGFYKGSIINIIRGCGAAMVLAGYDEVTETTKWKEKFE